MVAVPLVVPYTTPVDAFMDAMEASLVVQDPPALASVSVIVYPSQTETGPAIATGIGLTVKLNVR